MKNYTLEQKNALITQLLPFLNSMEQNGTGKFQIVATTKPEITFRDLMALSDAELEKLEALLKASKAAKKSQNESTKYESFTKPKAYEITDAPFKPNHKII